MPLIDGKELNSMLIQKYPHMKVLYMSGYTDNSIVQHGILDDGLSFIHKPFTSAVLLKKNSRCYWDFMNSQRVQQFP